MTLRRLGNRVGLPHNKLFIDKRSKDSCSFGLALAFLSLVLFLSGLISKHLH